MERRPSEGGRRDSGSKEGRVTFRKRDLTLASKGKACVEANSVNILANNYEGVFLNDDILLTNISKGKQFMILYIGCPRSLMGKSEYENLLCSLSQTERENIKQIRCSEKLRFGPSRLYTANFLVQVPLSLEHISLVVSFFVIDGDIPILIGNDILEPLGGIIDVEKREIELIKLQTRLSMIKSKSGHFVLPVIDNSMNKSSKEYYDISALQELSKNSDNVIGQEAEAVMLILFASCEEEKDLWILHEVMGHSNFVAMLLEKAEEEEVKKVHRYFGHKSGRKTWELFSKAGRLKGKKNAVIELLDKCKICREHKKTPPRPRVGMPVANSFNEVVGLDLKV